MSAAPTDKSGAAQTPGPGAIRDWHAHVYFDATSVDFAERICDEVSARYALEMGRVHRRPVGPHPRWSCQLTVAPDRFGAVLGWLALNRGGLTVFVHPNTGDALRDHRDRAVWLGRVEPLALDALG